MRTLQLDVGSMESSLPRDVIQRLRKGFEFKIWKSITVFCHEPDP